MRKEKEEEINKQKQIQIEKHKEICRNIDEKLQKLS